MIKTAQDSYDAIIIGAGISGLICGCYLAKAGMKVLIAEQHYKPGGYCSSFQRGDFTFDAAAHSFGGYRDNGIVKKVFIDLGIVDRLDVNRFEPSDIISTPDCEVSFWANVEDTVRDFQKAFPDETNNIHAFFNFLIANDPQSFARLRTLTFKNLLDQYFNNYKLKSILSFPLLGNGGLPASQMSAFIGARLFIEFLLDGGYYPKGGMQNFTGALSGRFKDFGGTLRLSSPVTEIVIEDKLVKGVILKQEGIIPSKYVISNCGPRQTFLKLIRGRDIGRDLSEKLFTMTTSLSMFVLYLGIDSNCAPLPRPGSNVWYLPHYDIEKMYILANQRTMRNVAEYMVRVSPDGQTILAFINAGYRDKLYWDGQKRDVQRALIKQIEQHTIPGLSKHILYQESATPHTMKRYTLNEEGAAYGWASTPMQFADPDFRKPSCVKGLFFTGHWATQGMGIPGVAYLGYDMANFILRKKRSRS
ncbi:MAG TPA: NAD(P)/FAD-dependent oxidoreductase [Nitrospirota bacterium]